MAGINWNELAKNAGHVGALPADSYDCEVIKAEYKKTSTGKDAFNVTFKVMNGPHANAPIYNLFVISPENANALGFFFRHMAAMGLDKDFFATNPSPQQVAQALQGRRATVKTKIEQYNGNDQTRVDRISPFAGQAPSATPTSASAPPPPPAPKTPKPKVESEAEAPANEVEDREPVSAGAGKATPPPAPF